MGYYGENKNIMAHSNEEFSIRKQHLSRCCLFPTFTKMTKLFCTIVKRPLKRRKQYLVVYFLNSTDSFHFLFHYRKKLAD